MLVDINPREFQHPALAYMKYARSAKTNYDSNIHHIVAKIYTSASL